MTRLVGANREFIEREIPHLADLLAPDPDSALEDAEVVVLGHAAPDAIDRIAAVPGRTVIDLQGVTAMERQEGLAYQGICW